MKLRTSGEARRLIGSEFIQGADGREVITFPPLELAGKRTVPRYQCYLRDHANRWLGNSELEFDRDTDALRAPSAASLPQGAWGEVWQANRFVRRIPINNAWSEWRSRARLVVLQWNEKRTRYVWGKHARSRQTMPIGVTTAGTAPGR
jgi:hypothetical protein